jgi:UDP-glucuronate decarboxylase
VNLGNPSEFTMLALAEKVLHQVGGQSKLVFQPLPADDPRQRKPVIDLAKEKIGWMPKVSLDDGLTKTIEYFRHILKA